jgi:DNA gyrase subunit B
LRELSYLNRRISITLNDLREKMKQALPIQRIFYSEGGIVEFVEMLDKNGPQSPDPRPSVCRWP